VNLSDTIVAVSSPEGAGERAVLRLSGADALRIADRVFVAADLSRPSAWPTYRAGPGRLEPPGAGLSVPAVLYVMRAPRSYTREDVAEFHVGAWPAVTGALVAGLMRAGARAGEPGEFTLRALVGGRLDLAQAEAVMAVVGAANEAALRAAGDLLRGHLSAEVARVADEVRGILVLVEADLDFSDQGIEAAPPEELARRIGAARGALADLGRRSRSLETFGGEVRLVIAGRPNVGKSSLFNRLLADAAEAGTDADRAIVAPEAGTTRDEVRAALRVGDLAFVLSDTAGLDETADELAGKARGRALEAIGRADLVLVAMDATAPSHDWMAEVIGLVTSPMVLVITKCDLAPPDAARRWLAARGVGTEVVATSAVTGRGLADLCDALVRAVEGGGVDRQAAGPVVTARHRAALEAAVVALARAARVARRPRGAGELVAMELRESLDALATVTGQRAGTDILDAIFSRFCIGK
jgi:tRNA modification GTPase